ncbi:spore coat associated protein CotJA [Halobacillus salinarum]|uniref:Spore coat associated protein CotJA n=1 Tax=Halobacillus salinarum TaxID=2932257 RepID=A0ABY4EFC2_9BACI|nr:spore coat associated protein CotJA [Halobacillus salinarum]UOQ42680.1 spore coat associated protein CotJA [Halobacillus salinarum]
MYTPVKCYRPYYGPFDPCPPIEIKCFSTPPQLYVGFQQPGLPQFSLQEALCRGTLWPCFYDPYPAVKGES